MSNNPVTRIYLARHGQTEGNVRNLFIGSTDVELDTLGHEQAKCLTERFRHEHFDFIVSSPLKRAVDTARYLSELTGGELVLDSRFTEIDFGDAELLSIREVEIMFPSIWEIHIQPGSRGVHWPNGESRESLFCRVTKGFEALLDTYAGKSIILVSHGGVIGAILSHFDDGMMNDWLGYSTHNCSVSLVEERDGRCRIVYSNDTGHTTRYQEQLFGQK